MSGWKNVHSGKCLSGEMSSRGSVFRGSVRSENCTFGEMSIGEVSVGEVSVGELYSGKCQSGNCPHIQSDTPMEIIGNSRQHGLGISSYSPELGLKGLAIKVLTTVNHNHKLKNMKKIA